MQVPPFSLSKQLEELGSDLDEAVLDVLRSGQYIGGVEVKAFEEAFSEAVGVPFVVGCNSGTDALVIALRAEVQPGENINLKIVREGKEPTQGIGYLDDGTMVVIEGARELIGKRLPVIITGALQTPTGRMIFGKLEKNHSATKPMKSGEQAEPTSG